MSVHHASTESRARRAESNRIVVSSLRTLFFSFLGCSRAGGAEPLQRLARVSATRTSARAEPGRRVRFGGGVRWWPSRGRRRRGRVFRPRARDVTTRREGEDTRRRRRLVRVDAERHGTKAKVPRRRARLPPPARPPSRAAFPSRTRTRHAPGNASTGRTRAATRPGSRRAVNAPTRDRPKRILRQTSPRLRIGITCAKRFRT